jgi:DNA repair protein SbcC/Rad50
MTVKINRIRIRNFKPFEDITVHFDHATLTVFDGPNGFGKTSFYDAVELLLTGRLRRYDEWVGRAADRRQTVLGSPVFNDRNGNGDLVIRGEIRVGDQTVCLVRIGKRQDLLTANRMENITLPLYTATDFENDNHTPIPDETDYLTRLLGKNYIQNFHFLNYIEQEDNIYLLKQKNTDRNQSIKHLFNTAGFEDRIDKLNQVSKTIGKLCGTEAARELKEKNHLLDTMQGKTSAEVTVVPYDRLIPGKEVGWDAQTLEFPGQRYVEYLGEEGELARLECFLNGMDEFRKEKENRKLDRLLVDESLALRLLAFWPFLETAEEFSGNLALHESIRKWLTACEEGIVEAIENNRLSLDPQIREIPKPPIDDHAFDSEIERIRELKNNSSKLATLRIEIKSSRRAFMEKYVKCREAIPSNGRCPLCGHSWPDFENLKAGFDAQTLQLEQLIAASGAQLNTAVEQFIKNYIEPIKTALTVYMTNHPLDESFVNKLKYTAGHRLELEELYGRFSACGIDLGPYLNDKPAVPKNPDLKILRTIIENKKQKVHAGKLRPWFDEIFLRLFDEDFVTPAGIDLRRLAQKRQYIEWQYSLHQDWSVKKLREEILALQKQFDDAETLKDKIDRTRKIYEESLKTYRKTLIENIGILFHIYSGRIMQEGQNGLGLFIKSDYDGICFVENHAKEHDAVFTMSSGQLAALVIAFTLALNKRYSKSLLLFIDDPIQTLDELNIAGFIELLRNEFADRQIFIATHEDMMSAYMRYKFDKYGLHTQRLSFKEVMLSPSMPE